MEYISKIQKLINFCCTEGLVDSLCMELGYYYDTTPGMCGEDIDQESFIKQNVWLPDQYLFKDWAALEDEISVGVQALKDDEASISHYLWSILSPINEPVSYFYSSRPNSPDDVFQRIVKHLVANPYFPELPSDLAAIHERYIDERLESGDVDFAPEQRDEKIKELCDNTFARLQKCKEIPSYKQCYHLKRQFARFATIIEAALLKNNCQWDLFYYQKQYETFLVPELFQDDFWANLGWSKEICVKMMRGYSKLDSFTEMAGYGYVYDQTEFDGVAFSGIPELDSLLLQTDLRNYPDYPTYHFFRNNQRFIGRCKEITETSESVAKKEHRLRNLVHLLGHCYTTFKETPRLIDYADYAIFFFSDLESAFLRAPEPICIKKMCMDLHYESLLEDGFPDTTIGKVRKMTKDIDSSMSWEEYGLRQHLKNSYDFFTSQACEQCARENCPYRCAACKIHGAIFEQKTRPEESPEQVYKKALISICKHLEASSVPGIKRFNGKDEWQLDTNDQLYAYIGVSLERHLKRKSTSWEKMSKVIHRTGSVRYLSKLGTLYRHMFAGDIAKDFPSSHHLVDDAIDNLNNGRKRS